MTQAFSTSWVGGLHWTSHLVAAASMVLPASSLKFKLLSCGAITGSLCLQLGLGSQTANTHTLAGRQWQFPAIAKLCSSLWRGQAKPVLGGGGENSRRKRQRGEVGKGKQQWQIDGDHCKPS